MPKNIQDYRTLTDDEIQNYLALHLPEGRAWAKKFYPDSNIFKFLKCIAAPFKYITSLINVLVKNIDTDEADELIDRYENDLSVPEIFPRLDTVAKRKTAVTRIQSKIPVYNIREDVVITNVVLPAILPVTLAEGLTYSSDIDDDTTYENYIKKVLDLDVVIYAGQIVLNTASFPLRFPFKFGVPYYQRQYTLFISILNEDFPYSETIKRKLNIILDRIIPVEWMWAYA